MKPVKILPHSSSEEGVEDEGLNQPEKPSYKGVTVRDAQFSESYDEYLECIYRLSLQNPAGWVKNKDISARLSVKAPSVTNMLEKLAKSQLINWKPRSGIRLTEEGKTRAKQIVMYHVLMELFLMRVLRMQDPELIDHIACDFEHHINPELKTRLIELLGISDTFSNVDDFILQDKLPIHIPTRPIFTEREVISIIDGVLDGIVAEIEIIPDLDAATIAQLKTVVESKRGNSPLGDFLP